MGNSFSKILGDPPGGTQRILKPSRTSHALIRHFAFVSLNFPTLWEEDEELVALRTPPDGRGEEFERLFTEGYAAYKKGDWVAAKEKLEAADAEVRGGGDGPSRAILRYMLSYDFQSPDDWDGARKLTAK